MDDKEFDKYIKEQLTDRKATSPDDWEDMHQILVDENIIEDDVSDSDFDEILKNHLDRASVPFNNNHWENLREKLLTEKYLRRRLAVAKILELAILFLFLITVLSKVPIKSELYAVHKYRPIYDQIAKLWQYDIQQITSTVDQKTMEVYLENTMEVHWPFLEENIVENKNTTQHSATYVSTVELSKDIAYLEIPNRNISPLLDIELDIVQKETRKRVITAAAGFGVNNIQTPFVSESGINDQSFNDIGRHVSLTYGRKYGKTEVYTGLAVNNASYKPAIENGVFDSYQGAEMDVSEIKDISYLLLHIPVGLRYHQIQRKTWSIYTSGALDLGMLAMATHNFETLSEDDIKSIEKTTSFDGGNSQVRNTLNSNLSKGIFQGGSFLDNFGLSATVGIGFVKNVNKNISFFVEPSYTYSFSFDGIGVHNEEINNYKLNLGVRLLL